jgi:hypothetical protein
MAQEHEEQHAGMSESEMRDNLVRLVFQGDAMRLDRFCAELVRALPAETAAVLRGSSITGQSHEGGPFDAEGPGTSDLDLTLVGGEVLDWFEPEGFYIPGAHSKPLSEKDPDISPRLVPLREKLSAMVGRPVNIQGTRDWVMFVREHLMNQPYLTLIGKLEPT